MTGASSWQGKGWWQASDGMWYPPEAHPDYGPPRRRPPDLAANAVDDTAEEEVTISLADSAEEVTISLTDSEEEVTISLADSEEEVTISLADALRKTRWGRGPTGER